MLPLRMMKAGLMTAGLLGLGFLVGTATLPAQSAKAQGILSGINPPPAPSTPTCGLGTQDYPDCPVDDDEARVAEGYAIAPVGLNLTGLDIKKVGIGSYWMNSAGNCSGCHASPTLGNGGKGGQYTSDGNPQQLPVSLGGTYAYASVVNPYNPPAIINAAGYLAGGSNFGNPNCDPAGGGACGPTVIVRNLTPDYATGVPLPEGNTLENFKKTLRTGHDFQQVHLNCPPGPGTAPYCINPPSDGSKLQVMPWPALSILTDYDLEAIYAYLSSIPCISNAGSQYPQIVHDCTADTAASHHKYSYTKGKVTRMD